MNGVTHFAISCVDKINPLLVRGFVAVNQSSTASSSFYQIGLYTDETNKVTIQKSSKVTDIRSEFSQFTLAQDHSMILVSDRNKLNVYDLQDDFYSNNRSKRANNITHKHIITCVAHNAKRNLIAFGDERGAIMVYHPSGAHSLLHWHPVVVNSLDFSSDGNYMYSVANDGVMCMWNISKGSRMNHFPCGQALNHVTVSPKQDSCLIVSAGNQVLKVDLHGNKDKFDVQGILAHNNPMSVQLRLAVHPTSGEVSITGSNILQWYDIENEKETKRNIIQYQALTYNPSRYEKTKPLTHVITHIAVSGTGHRVATCEKINDQTCLKFWHLTKYKCETLSVVDTPHGADITSCAFNQSARAQNMCVTTSLDGNAKLWNRSGEMEHHVCYAIIDYRRLKPWCAVFSIDGNSVIIGFEHVITVWDAKSATLVLAEEFTDGQGIRSVHCLDDHHIVVQTRNCVYIYSLVKAKIVWSIALGDTITLFAFHQNSRQMAFKLLEQSSVHILSIPRDVSQTKRTAVSACEVLVKAINFSTKGQLLVLTDAFDILTLGGKTEEEKESNKTKVQISDSAMDIDMVDEKPTQKLLNPDTVQTTAFDPELGMNAWKDIFGGHSSHQLMSMNDSFGTYMNTFLLKSDLHKQALKKESEQASQKEKTAFDYFKNAAAVSHQTATVPTENELSKDIEALLKKFATTL